MRSTALIPTLLFGTMLIACDDGGPSAPADDVQLDDRTLTAFLGTASAGPSGTFACPAGGEIERAMEAEATVIGDTVDVTFDVEMEHHDCTVEIEGDPFIIDGRESMEGRQRAVRDGQSVRLLSSVIRRTGRTRVRFRDYDRTCDIDLTQTWDPDTGVHRLTGTMCGNTMDVVLPGMPRPTG